MHVLINTQACVKSQQKFRLEKRK